MANGADAGAERARGAARPAAATARERRSSRRRARCCSEAASRAMTLDAVATEAGMSKAGLYYYFPSKDALVFELVYGVFERLARTVDAAVRKSEDGGGRAPRHRPRDGGRLRAAHRRLPPRLHARAGGRRRRARAGAPSSSPGSARSTTSATAPPPPGCSEEGGAPVEPRLMAFLAHLAAIGLLTMKGMVEQQDDPLVFSDEELVEAFGRVFEAALSR